MSTIKTINVQHPSSSTINVTLDSSGNTSVAGNLSFNSGYGSVATAYGCRAWVNFNGTGTVAIRADGGVSSITDNGTGSYTVNFDVSLPDTNYAVSGFSSRDTNGFGHVAQYGVNAVTDMAVGSIRVQCVGYTSSFDAALVCVSVFR